MFAEEDPQFFMSSGVLQLAVQELKKYIEKMYHQLQKWLLEIQEQNKKSILNSSGTN